MAGKWCLICNPDTANLDAFRMISLQHQLTKAMLQAGHVPLRLGLTFAETAVSAGMPQRAAYYSKRPSTIIYSSLHIESHCYVHSFQLELTH